MEKGLARFRVSLLCFCCGWLLQLVCCDCFGALRWQTAAGGPSHFVGPFPFREPMPPATVCHLSAAGTPTASWPSAQSGCQCRPAAVCHLSAAGTPTASWHGDHAHKYSRGIPAWRRGHLSTLWHGDPAYKGLSAIPACQSISQPTSNRSHPSIPPGPRHGDPTHNALSATPAWRRGHLSTLWHGDPQQNHFWGRVTWQDCLEPVSNRSLADASAGLRHGILGERPLGGILAWRGSHLSALRP